MAAAGEAAHAHVEDDRRQIVGSRIAQLLVAI
jgi:hypothetical protein